MKADLDALESAWGARDELVCWEMTPALIAELRRLRAENETMREALEGVKSTALHRDGAVLMDIARKALEGL